jgi:hypothetical protein
VHREERHERHRGAEVDRDQEPAARGAVDEDAAERREHGGGDDGEEREARGGVRASELLGPDAEHEEHRAVAEERQRLPGEQEPRVAHAEQGAEGGRPLAHRSATWRG